MLTVAGWLMLTGVAGPRHDELLAVLKTLPRQG